MMRLQDALVIFLCPRTLSVHANDRPAGIPEEARYAKVDRVIDAVVVMAVFAVAVDDDAESNYSHYFGSAPKLSYAVSLRGL